MSQPELGQSRMSVGTAPKGPAILALGFDDRKVVDARVARRHEPVLVELPVLVAVGAVPLPRIVMPLVSEAHGDPRTVESPQLLDETIVELFRPLARQELHDLRAAGGKLGPVAPPAVFAVRERNAL